MIAWTTPRGMSRSRPSSATRPPEPFGHATRGEDRAVAHRAPRKPKRDRGGDGLRDRRSQDDNDDDAETIEHRYHCPRNRRASGKSVSAPPPMIQPAIEPMPPTISIVMRGRPEFRRKLSGWMKRNGGGIQAAGQAGVDRAYDEGEQLGSWVSTPLCSAASRNPLSQSWARPSAECLIRPATSTATASTRSTGIMLNLSLRTEVRTS